MQYWNILIRQQQQTFLIGREMDYWNSIINQSLNRFQRKVSFIKHPFKYILPARKS